ncbi:MAG: helix-hairpin-helix domain-containing protein [Thermaerobacterales bacterium]
MVFSRLEKSVLVIAAIGLLAGLVLLGIQQWSLRAARQDLDAYLMTRLAGDQAAEPALPGGTGHDHDQTGSPGAGAGTDAAAAEHAAGVAAADAHDAGSESSRAGAAGPDLVVHVAGAVQAPGVYRLAAGARTVDAVTMAGGAAAEADLDRVNLAAQVLDGQRLYIPVIGKDPPPLTEPEPAGAGSDANGRLSPVDLNRAGASELQRVPGIGPVLAARIIEDRRLHGRFSVVEDLLRVSGIGAQTLSSLRPYVIVTNGP